MPQDTLLNGYSEFLKHFDVKPAQLYRYIYRTLGNRLDSEDVFSVTCSKARKSFDSLRSDSKGAAKVWLFRIARNTCIDEIRGKQSSRNLLSLDYLLSLDTIEDTPSIANDGVEKRIILQQTVRQAVSDLKPEYRDPIILTGFEGLSAKEAAFRLDLSVPTLKSRVYRGRRILRKGLEGAFGYQTA